MTGPQSAGPLRGLRVLDMGHNITAPVCAQMLGMLGADVVKLEEPRSGDNSRIGPPFLGADGVSFSKAKADKGVSLSFLKRNRYKRSITLNLKSDEGRDLFFRLLPSFDVLVENFRPGALAKLKITVDGVRQTNPGLIICSISGFGQTGPQRNWVAYDGIIQAFSGLVARTGYAEDPPVKAGLSAADTLGALYGVIGVLAALEQRRNTGRGEYLDISMLQCVLSALWDDPLDVFDRFGMKTRSGNNNQRAAPWNMYEASDGHVFVCALSNDQWERLSAVMGIAKSAKFESPSSRLEHFDEIDSCIGDWCKSRTRYEITLTLQQAGVPSSGVFNPVEVKEASDLGCQELFRPVGTSAEEQAANVVVARSPLRVWEGESTEVPAPGLGEHNYEVYATLGLSTQDVDALAERHVL